MSLLITILCYDNTEPARTQKMNRQPGSHVDVIAMACEWNRDLASLRDEYAPHHRLASGCLLLCQT